jgi:hypothetical protein
MVLVVRLLLVTLFDALTVNLPSGLSLYSFSALASGELSSLSGTEYCVNPTLLSVTR